jgi:hypothetical protein
MQKGSPGFPKEWVETKPPEPADRGKKIERRA